MNSVIIVAAGNSTRMGTGQNKQFICLNNIPVIVRTLKAFSGLPEIHSITVVTRECDIETMLNYINEYKIPKVTSVIKGGDTRQESVLCGLKAQSLSDNDNILIHDGARPFIHKENILAVIGALNSGKYKAAAVGVPPKDTIKQVDDEGIIVNTPDRSSLISIQTPQGFKFGLIMKAHLEADSKGISVTDDCAVAEAVTNEKIKVIEGDYNNIKITTPEDVVIGEKILENSIGG